MKRITYISRVSAPLSKEEIDSIGTISLENNEEGNITGLLVFFEKMFFQIIEGDEEAVDLLYAKIGKDTRHRDILRLKTEYEVDERLFPSWSMKTINLDEGADDLIRPIRILLQSVIESYAIIEQYTQPTIIKMLNKGINPLSVSPVPVQRIILFADIVSYSTIGEKLSMDDMLLILNTYFEICSRVILNRGGEVNKFLGDGLMAYFNIEQADDAIESCLDILAELRILRQNSEEDSPLKLLYSGFGLAQGRVIEGNMGSDYKKDYTIIGDAVNIAARLEGLTRETNHPIVLSEMLKDRTQKQWKFVNLGRYNLKGREKDSTVYSIDHELVNEFAKHIRIE